MNCKKKACADWIQLSVYSISLLVVIMSTNIEEIESEDQLQSQLDIEESEVCPANKISIYILQDCRDQTQITITMLNARTVNFNNQISCVPFQYTN